MCKKRMHNKGIFLLYVTAMCVIFCSVMLLSGCDFAKKVSLKFSGEHVSCDAPAQISTDKDLELNLTIDYISDDNATWEHVPDPQNTNSAYPEGKLTTPVEEYELLIQNIKVYVDGVECKDAFTWSYQNNIFNTLKVKKEYLTGDVSIVCNATPHTSTLTLYGYEIVDEILDAYNNGTLNIEFKKAYQNAGMQYIRTLSNGKAFPVFEDDSIDVTFTSTTGMDLSDLWFRTNSRFTEEGVEFTREFSNNNSTVTFHVPNYVVRDHGSFKIKGEGND